MNDDTTKWLLCCVQIPDLCPVKNFLVALLLIITSYPLAAQRIHAHNDYQQPRPLTNALQHKVFSIEADVYLTRRGLVVAHDKKDTAAAPLLETLYLQPIITLFNKHKGRISADKKYTPVLMIDSKESLLSSGGEAVIATLIKLLAPYRSVFDRSVNTKAVQIVISGDRGAISKWSSYPSYLLFDGRPAEVYDSAARARVAFISDSYTKYVSAGDSTSQVKELVKKIHSQHQLLRLWGHPDNAGEWKRLQQLGVDIINTDKVEECSWYFLKAHSQQ